MARKLVAVRLDDDTIEAMKRSAKNLGVDVSEMHRRTLVAAFGGGQLAPLKQAQELAPPKGEIPISSESNVKRPNKATQKIQTRKSPAKKADDGLAAAMKARADGAAKRAAKKSGPAATAKPAGRAREVEPNFKQKG